MPAFKLASDIPGGIFTLGDLGIAIKEVSQSSHRPCKEEATKDRGAKWSEGEHECHLDEQ